MSTSALRVISDPVSLSTAWKHIRRQARRENGGSSGVDGQRPIDFKHNESANIADLGVLLSSGSFRFRDLRVTFIEKPGGGTRIICIPTVRDRIVQRALLHFLTADDKCKILNAVSYGFTKNCTVHDAASDVVSSRNQKQWVYKTDITSFFDNIDRDTLKSVIRKKVRHRSLHRLLIDAACREIYEPNRTRATRAKKHGIKPGNGVRQGMPLSPFFSNLFLHEFDRVVENANVSMVRYADDLIVLCDSRNECLDVDKFCREHLIKRGLNLPPITGSGKTRIYEPNQTAEFLGLGLIPDGKKYKLDLTSDQKEKIKRRIKQFGSVDYLAENHINIFSFGRKIDGVIAGYLGSYANCASFNTLEQSLDELRSLVTHELFSNTFNINVSTLEKSSRAFLCLPMKKPAMA